MSLRTIRSLSPIEGADRIELALVDGWEVVVAKGIHSVGDTVAYLEIDSFLPETEPMFESFVARGTKPMLSGGEEVRGHVLRTVKLRGQISQGAILPLSEVGLSAESTQDEVDAWMATHGVVKYEPPLVASSPDIVGVFPSMIRKTDSERVQNLSDEFLASLDPARWVATEKIDGTSATFWADEEGVLRAASRNWEVSLDAPGSLYRRVADALGLADLLAPGQVLQGEIYGEGVQGNPLKVNGVHLAVFSSEGISSDDPAWSVVDTGSVPPLPLTLPQTVAEAVAQADGLKSVLNPKVNAEGIVWWNLDGTCYAETGDRANFKAINNRFLLKQG